jgi:hypothetical protein
MNFFAYGSLRVGTFIAAFATIALTSCNGKVLGKPDAIGGDDATTGTDGSNIDAAPMFGPAEVTVYNANGVLESGSRVLFVSPDGSTVESAFTDATGKVSRNISSGSTVHVVPTVGDTLLTTLAVNPGDKLVYGRFNPGLQGTLGTMTVRLRNPPQGGGGFRALYGCATGSVNDAAATTLTVGLRPGCEQFDLLIGVLDSNGTANHTAWSYSTGHTFVDGGIIDSSTNWVPQGAVQIALQNKPSNVGGTIYGTANYRIAGGEAWTGITGPGTAVSLGSPFPILPIPSRFEVTLNHSNLSLKPMTTSQLLPIGAAPAIDFAPTSLPWMTMPTYDAATRKIQWTVDGTGTPTMTHALITYKTNAGAPRTWIIVAPGAATTSMALPTLPPELSAQDLATATNIVPQVQLLRFNAPLTYNEVRGDALARSLQGQFFLQFNTWAQDPRVTGLTASGGR